jgi:hypothetical protein
VSVPRGTRSTTDALLAPIEGGFGTCSTAAAARAAADPPRRDALSLAARRWRTGDSLRVGIAGTGEDVEGCGSRPRAASSHPGGFPPVTGGLPPLGLMSSAYFRAHPDSYQVFFVRLRDGTRGISAFTRELTRLSPNAPVVTSNRIEMTAPVQRGLDVQATALRLLGAVVAVLTILLLGQALARLATVEADDDDVLRELGFVSAQLRTRALGRGVVIGVRRRWSQRSPRCFRC